MNFVIHVHDSAFQLLIMFTCILIFQKVCGDSVIKLCASMVITAREVLWSDLSPNTGLHDKIFMPFFSTSGICHNSPSN